MLLTVKDFGGIAPKILDPSLLPANRSQAAQNCRFDQGGIVPLFTDLQNQDSPKADTMSLFVYYNGGAKYIFTWDSNVNAVKIPLANDSYNRIFYTEAGKLRVTDKNLFRAGGSVNIPASSLDPSPPAPAAAPVIAGTPSGTDPTLLETRGYVYTYVNSYGSEGPPSLVSNLLAIYDGNTVTISGMSTAPAADYSVTKKRIYRINQTTNAATQYQFVTEIEVVDTGYVDTILDAALGEVLASTEWDGPPAGIQGLIALPNGVLAGFVDNLVCFSVPWYPHAWPASYQKAADFDIMGLGAYGTTVIALTTGYPYVIVGNDPANAIMEKIEGLSCVSTRGVVTGDELTLYPSPYGLNATGPQTRDVATKLLMNQREWNELYSPTTITGFFWEGKYVGFYNGAAGFMFDPKTGDLVNLDFFATAGYYDQTDGSLYLVIDGTIYLFNQGLSYRTTVYQSRRNRFPLTCFGWVKVMADEYPVALDIVYPTIPRAVHVDILSDLPQRLPTFLIDSCEVKIHGAFSVSAVFLASTAEELPV